MDLFLVRHAEAEDKAPGGTDAARPLTKRGRDDFEDVVRGLRRAGVEIDLILHSPLLRTVETAEILADVLVKGGETRATRLLAEPPGAELLAELRGERVACVGHEPHLPDLASWLLLGSARHGAALSMKKGGVAWLVGEPRPAHARLVAFLPPSVSRKLR
jgi:phosphohistidine phosphatase